MTYEPRAKGRVRTAVRTTEKWIKGDGIGLPAPQPLPLMPFLLGKPVEDITGGSSGKVLPQVYSCGWTTADDPTYVPDDDEDPGIEVCNPTQVTLKDDQWYLFAWVQGYWMAIFTPICSED